jgi:integrase
LIKYVINNKIEHEFIRSSSSIPPSSQLLSTADFDRLADVPLVIECSPISTIRKHGVPIKNALEDFIKFTGIERPDEFRKISRAHVIAWRDDLKYRELSGMTIRHRLAALSSLFEYLGDKNAVTHNPVKDIKRPSGEDYQGKMPAIGDHQARGLLEAPKNVSLRDKRDRAILATLLYHALRREELCKLLVKDFKHERRGVAHLKVSGKGGKTRYIPLHPAAGGLVLDIWKRQVMGLILLAPSSGPFVTTAPAHWSKRSHQGAGMARTCEYSHDQDLRPSQDPAGGQSYV